MRSFRLWAVIFSALLLQAPGWGASFDCVKASSPREKLICGTPSLSEQDGQLGRLYQEKRALLSPQGAKLLQNSEQAWLRHLATVCPPNASKTDIYVWEPKLCLQRQYSDRLQQLEKVAVKLGPFLFSRIDLFVTKTLEDGRSESWHIAYPQIDNIDTPAAQAWNKRVEKAIDATTDCEDGAEEDVDYSLGYANDRLISLTWMNGSYCTGAPHGFGTSHGETLVLAPTLHSLDVAELFGPGWRGDLRNFFWESLQEQGWKPPDEGAKESLLDAAVDPQSWLFTKEGIQVVFSAYEGGCYACNPQEPVIASWAKLKPLILPAAPLP